MPLAEESKLSLDDSVREHIRELGAGAEGVTLAGLVSHTSGSGCNLDQAVQIAGSGELWVERMTEMMLSMRDVKSAPVDGWSCCNNNDALLTEVVKRVGDKTFEEVLQERSLIARARATPWADRCAPPRRPKTPLPVCRWSAMATTC
jgi:CubicO group peptidase (beta-lactamase class C family)